MNTTIKTTLTCSLHCLCKIPKIESRDEWLIATPVKLDSQFQNLVAKAQRKNKFSLVSSCCKQWLDIETKVAPLLCITSPVGTLL